MELELVPIGDSDELFAHADRIFRENFPRRTQLSSEDFRALQKQGILDYRVIRNGSGVIGFYNAFLSESIVYLFFFSIDRPFQSRGFGSAALQKIRATYPGQVLVLDMEEVDPAADNYRQRCRRRDFYRRNGLHESGQVLSYYGGTFTVLAAGAFVPGELRDLLCGVSLPGFYPVLLPDPPEVLETERLILRPWEERDAEDLYRLASHPDIGPRAGWPVHTSVAHSRTVIRTVLSARETYAVVLKSEDGDHPVGSVGIKFAGNSDLASASREAELGCWIGKEYWGQGLIPEALTALIRRCFDTLGIRKIWYGYYEGNDASRRAAEKCGFREDRRESEVPVPLLHTTRPVRVLSREPEENGN